LKNADVFYPESEDDVKQPIIDHPRALGKNSRSNRNISAGNSPTKVKESLNKSSKVQTKGKSGRVVSKKRSECSLKSANGVVKKSISERSYTATRKKSRIVSQYSAQSAKDQSEKNAKPKFTSMAASKDTQFIKSESIDKIDAKNVPNVNSSVLDSFELFKVQSSSVRKQ
jgi:hypothetical protein